jgi:EmrB/QacA subfamily drug resistance transporter
LYIYGVREERAMPRRWWALVAVSLATFMTYLDNNVTNVAIPTIQRSLHLSVAGLEWVVSSYILVFAGLLLAGGRLADVYGRRRLFVAGLSVFTLASLGAGLAGSGGVLIGFRLVQGVGAALLVPTTLAILVAAFDDRRERAAAIGAWTAIGASALAAGPLIGGIISQHFHWGWIFFINVPVGVVTMVLALITVSESRDATAARHLDLPGLVTSALMLFALTYALIEGQDKGWTSGLILGSFALSALAAGLFVLAEARSAAPMVNLSLFRSRVFSGGTVTMMLWAFGVFGIYFFTSLYLQDILGFSPTKAGLVFVPMAALLIVSAGIAPLISARLAPHRTVALGMLIMAAGLALFGRLGASATFASLMPGILLFGAGAGLMQVPLTNAVLHSMPPARSGVAAALLNASREVAGLLGITLIGAVLRARQGDALRHGTSAARSFLAGYHAGVLLTVILIAAGVVVSYVALRKLPRTEPASTATASTATASTATAGRELAGPLAEMAEAAAAELAG